MYLDSCKEMVEKGESIRRGEQKKCKLEESLEEVNGQLVVLNRHYTQLQQRNYRLKAAYMKKLTFTTPSVGHVKGIVKQDSKVESEFADDDNENLVRACKETEEGNI